MLKINVCFLWSKYRIKNVAAQGSEASDNGDDLLTVLSAPASILVAPPILVDHLSTVTSTTFPIPMITDAVC